MTHVGSQALDAFARLQSVPRREALHINRCIPCRHAAAAHGIADDRIAAASGAADRRGIIAASVTAGVIALAVVAAPLRGTASAFLAIFEPHTVRALPVTLDELRNLGTLPGLSAYASSRELRSAHSATFAAAGPASAAAGFAVRQPTDVPSGVLAASYFVTSPSAELIRFNAHAAHAGGATLPPDIAGSTLELNLGATVIANYETGATAADQARLRQAMTRLNRSNATSTLRQPAESRPPGMTYHLTVVRNSGTLLYSSSGNTGIVTSSTSPRARTSGPRVFAVGRFGGVGDLPLVVVQMPVPQIASTGVSVGRLAAYMLSQPGVSPRLAAAFGALGDLSTTLPIPIPIDKAYTQPVFVNGVQGLGLGDDTGIGAAVIWQRDGMLYGVFAPRTAREVLAIANSVR